MKTKLFKSLLIVLSVIFFGALLFFVATKAFDSKKSFVVEVKQEERGQPESLIEENTEQEKVEFTEIPKENVPEQIKTEDVAEEKSDEKNEAIPESSLSIKNKLTSWGFEVPKEKRIVDSIILHSSYDALGKEPYDVEGLIAEYKQYGVSPHYLIDRKGTIYRLVADENIAYHAGQSKTPDGRSGVNDFSIGIELMNTTEDKFTEKQYSSLESLLSKLKKSYNIKYLLGHNEIAPGRKTDPWNFDWKKIGR